VILVRMAGGVPLVGAGRAQRLHYGREKALPV
jgi:hypothetical protein